MADSPHEAKPTKYDVALSFAGEDRQYVDEVAGLLRAGGIRVFYDKYEEAVLWGKDLYVHLRDVYSRQARYSVLFLSRHYANKLWTNHERESAQARAFEENREYLLPARFDDTPIPGILRTIGYVDLRQKSPEALVELIKSKVAENTDVRGPRLQSMEGRDVFWPSPRPSEVILDVSLGAVRSRFAVQPTAYRSLRELLDDLFIQHLSTAVSAFSYGSEWLLVGEPFRTRIAAPVGWIDGGGAIIRRWPTWASRTTLTDEGLLPGTYWEATSVDSVAARGYYAALTSNPEVARLATTEAKAMALLARHHEHFDIQNLQETDTGRYRFQLVFRDWLSIAPGKVLVDRGKDLPREVLEIFAKDR